MKWFFFGLIVVHALIHAIGFAKGVGLGKLEQLTQPISKGMGLLWLAAALTMLTTGLLQQLGLRSWWLSGVVALLLSQTAIVSAWGDAKFGTVANVLIMVGVVYGFASQGPLSFRASYLDEVRGRLANPASPRVVTEADLEPLPQPVRCYIQQSGAVGQPRIHHFRATWQGRIRRLASDPWMEFTAEQTNFVEEPARFFVMNATKGGLPVDVFHAFRDGKASMRVRLLSLVPMVNSRGSELDRAETVTLFNDLCLLAPAALAHPGIRWKAIHARSVTARFTHGAHTISAVLYFNDYCELVDFVSDDRLAASQDGSEFVKMRWSTPVRDYRSFGPRRVATRGQGRWHPAEGDYAYLEIELLDLQVNGPAP
jgi:hypothetical protein